MFFIILQESDTLCEVHSGVQPLGVAKRSPGATNVKEIFCCCTDKSGFWSTHHYVVGVIHAKGDLCVDVLLGVLRTDGVDQPPETREITARRSTGHALVERLVIDHQETRWRATLHVEFRGEDVAEAADSVSQFTMKLGQAPLWGVRSVDREHLAPASSETTTGSRMRFRIDAEVAPTLPTISADAETEPSSVGDSHG